MTKSHNVALLGAGRSGIFYTMALHGNRGRHRARSVYSRTKACAEAFAQAWGIPAATGKIIERVVDL